MISGGPGLRILTSPFVLLGRDFKAGCSSSWLWLCFMVGSFEFELCSIVPYSVRVYCAISTWPILLANWFVDESSCSIVRCGIDPSGKSGYVRLEELCW